MHDDDATLALLSRTPPEIPEFAPDLAKVLHRGVKLKRRRTAGRAVTGLVLASMLATPLLVLGGLFGTSLLPTIAGQDHPLKLLEYYEPSGSMEPTVSVGQTVLIDENAYRFGQAPALADIVLFERKTEGQTFELLKRVIGLPGQTVEIHRGVVFVDGNQLTESYLNSELDLRDFGPFPVPEGSLFVLGDNRVNSNDSRFAVGMVPLADVIGKMVGPAGPGVHGRPPKPGVVRLGGLPAP